MDTINTMDMIVDHTNSVVLAIGNCSGVNNATAVYELFKSSEFESYLMVDATANSALAEFKKTLDRKTNVIIFISGGLEYTEKSYEIKVQMDSGESYSITDIVKEIGRTTKEANIVIFVDGYYTTNVPTYPQSIWSYLDYGCDNYYCVNQMISYDAEEYGIFTKLLIEYLQKDYSPLLELLPRVQRTLIQQSDYKQKIFRNSNLDKDLFFCLRK